MSHNFELSVTGLALIKSFEGFRPVDRTLVNGQRVVGYGHKVRGDASMIVTRTEANEILKDDLRPYEDMVNNEVYAPLNQHQFDALVSLAFSLGPKAFQLSPTLHLVNNGRPLDAARSFEVWRKSRINGRTYIVDALVRRRAAEKALFLRLDSGYVAAPRVALKPIEDTRLIGDIMSGDLPVFKSRDLGIVKTVPYEEAETTEVEDFSVNSEVPNEPSFEQKLEKAVALDAPRRRREDGPAGILTLSEIVEDGDLYEDDADMYELEGISEETPLFNKPSPIALAAAEVSGRLDALIDKTPDTLETADWPESLITSDRTEDLGTKVQDLETLEVEALLAETDPSEGVMEKPVADITESELGSIEDAYLAEMAAEEIEQNARLDMAANDYAESAPVEVERRGGLGPYLVIMMIGLTLIGASIGAMMRGGTTQFGDSMPFWSGVGLIVGAVVLLVAMYYVLKSILRRV